jgi:hypothetical protein
MAYWLKIERFQSRAAKLSLGAMTLFPVVYTTYFIAVYFFLSDSPNTPYSDGFTYLLFAGQWAIFFLYLVLLASYIAHLSRFSFVGSQARLICWLVAFLFGGSLGMFVYWCANIWPISRPVISNAL